MKDEKREKHEFEKKRTEMGKKHQQKKRQRK